MAKFVGSIHHKESISDFISKNSNINDLNINNLYKLLINIFSCSVSSRKVKLNIRTTEYVYSVFRRNSHNFNAAFVSIILNMQTFNFFTKLDEILTSYSNKDNNLVSLNKFISIDVLRISSQFIPEDKRDSVINNIGILFDYYYVINR